MEISDNQCNGLKRTRLSSVHECMQRTRDGRRVAHATLLFNVDTSVAIRRCAGQWVLCMCGQVGVKAWLEFSSGGAADYSLHGAPDLHLANLAAIADGTSLEARGPARKAPTVRQNCTPPDPSCLPSNPAVTETVRSSWHSLMAIVHWVTRTSYYS